MDIAVSEYRKRRADRLAVRGIRPKYNSNWDYPQDITRFGGEEKKIANRFHMDDPDDDNNNNNQESGKTGGGHGNTHLPFGLCLRYGVEIGADWTPRDAWAALAGKGITPDGAFEKLKKGEDPGTPDSAAIPEPEVKKPSVNVTIADDEYKVTGATKRTDYDMLVKDKKRWTLMGKLPGIADEGELKQFASKAEMLQFLKEQGVEKFTDPETGELLNPKEMELPKIPKTSIVSETSGAEYSDLVGRKRGWVSRGDNPWLLAGRRVEGTGEGHYSDVLRRTFKTKGDMLRYLKDRGIEEFTDPETGEIVNPLEMELPKIVMEDRDRTGYTKILLGIRDGKYTVTGTDLDYKSRKLYDATAYAAVKDFLKSRGMDPKDAKLSPALRKKEAERLSWLKSDKKEYFTDTDGTKYGDLSLRPGDWRSKVDLYGTDEEGREIRHGFGTRAEAMEFLKSQGVEKVKVGDEIKNPTEYVKPTAIATIDGKEYQKVGILVTDYATRMGFYGIDLDGDYHRLGSRKYDEDVDEFKQRLMREHGITEDQITISDEDKEKIEDIKKAEEEKVRRRREFEAKALTFGASKYIDPVITVDEDGDFKMRGYDRDGDMVSISGFGDMHDMVRTCERFGYDPQRFIKDPKVQEAYDKYLEARKDFDAKAKEFEGRKYVGIEITHEGRSYYVRGYDERGRLKDLAREGSYDDLERHLRDSGYGVESFPMSDEAKKKAEIAKKSKELINTGEWYSMGKKDSAFKEPKIEKEGPYWSIYGVNPDGEKELIGSYSSWDEAISDMGTYGVKSYTVRDGDKELGMPTNGMHGVVLMRKPGGGFSVIAATKDSPSSTVYETDNEADARKWLEDNNVPSAGIKSRGMNPNDDVVRTHTAPSLSSFDAHRMKAIEGSFIDDMTDDEKKEAADMLTELFSKGEYRAARGLTNFGNIIEGGYKSQIETGTGGRGAALTRSGRISTSRKMYGHNGLASDSDYEKMGYLAPADDVEDYSDSGHPFYGPMTLTFKKENMKDRATYTWGDSLNTTYRLRSAGYAGEHPTIEGFTALYDIGEMRDILRAYRDYKDGKISYSNMFKKIRDDANNQYIEMQFNGPVTVDDISKASWQSSKDMKKSFDSMKSDQRKRVLKTLKDKNIGLIYKSGDKFVDAWDWLKEHYADDMPA